MYKNPDELHVQVKVEALGRLYASLGKRHGKIVQEEMVEGSSTFSVTAHLPVVESFQFAQGPLSALPFSSCNFSPVRFQLEEIYG